MFNNADDMIKNKKIIINSDIPKDIKNQIIKNLNWGILSIQMNKNEDTRKKFRDMISKKIREINPHLIKYINENEIHDEVSFFMKNHFGKGIKTVFVIESQNKEVNDMVLFYE